MTTDPSLDSKPHWKPAAAARTHLLAAASMWSVVGLGLAAAGLHWTLASVLPWRGLALAGALVAGLLKARFVLDRSARKAVARIIERGDSRCLGGFQSPGSWALVLLMVLGGRALRHWVLPQGVAGLLYVAIGVALLWASRIQWRAYRAQGRQG